MKKLLSLLLACMLLLSLSSVAFAEPVGTVTFEATAARLNVFSNTIAVRAEGGDYFQLISAEGEVLVSTDEQYVDMDPMSDLPFFKVKKDTGDPLNCNGMIDGTGKLLVPAKYALVEDYSERWLVGFQASPSTGEDDQDLHSWFDSSKTYRIDALDFYFDGEYVGTLTRSDYFNDNGVRAFGAYIYVLTRDGERRFYNSRLEQSPYEASDSSEFDAQYDDETEQYIYYHQGSGQRAFVPECTLDPADLKNPYLYVDGVLYDIKGQELASLPYGDYDVEDFVDGCSIVKLNDKYGVITSTGEELVPAVYDEIIAGDHPFRFGYIGAVKDGMFGFLDASGQPVGDFVYPEDELDDFYKRPNFAVLEGEDESYTVISAAVGPLPEIYAEVHFPDRNGCLAFVAEKEDGTEGVVDLYGNVLVPFGDYLGLEVSVDGTVALGQTEDGFTVYRF